MSFHRAVEDPIYVFTLDGDYFFKHYFEDVDLFKELSSYYNAEEYHFTFTEDDFDDVNDILSDHGYSLVEVPDIEMFVVAKRKYTDHPDVLFKKSILQKSERDYNLFLMQNEDAVDQAIQNGAVSIAELECTFTD